MTTKLLTAAIFATALSAFPQPVYAVNVPSFTSCVNPQGSLKVSYDSGVHGVAGMTDEKRGSDKVYSLVGNSEVTQCFCPENGNGIQTNWWKIKDLSTNDIQKLKSEGWIYIADGSVWGLDQNDYLAKNSDYNCKPKEEKKEEKKVQSVVALASTGNIAFVYGTLAAAIVATLAGITLRIKNK